MGAGAVIAGVNQLYKNKNNKQLQKEIANAPRYKVQDEAYENQAIARSQAYGRDRSIQMQQENIGQEAANSAYNASRVTGSTSSLLSTIAAINANKNQNLRGLGQDEASLMNQKRQQLYGANNAMIDEKDKSWNYNVNMPYQMKIAALRDKIQGNSEQINSGINYETSTSSSFMGSMGGMMGGK